jgi:SHS2 domain-containing protein
MKKYEILDHPTDLKIRSFGKTKEELFSNMLGAMFHGARAEILTTPSPSFKRRGLRGGLVREIKIKSADEQSLLVDFLNEALTLSDINNEAYFEVKFKKLTGMELAAEIFSQPIEKMGLEIKAVTYHGVEIKKVSGGWEATVLFDI